MPHLPEEVYWLIVSYMSQDRARLHALLLTNRMMFRIAVGYLYASPFKILDFDPNYHWTVVERTKRYDKLVHLLLTSSKLFQESNNDRDEGDDVGDGATTELGEPAGKAEREQANVGGTPQQKRHHQEEQQSQSRRRSTRWRLPRYGPEVLDLPYPATCDYLSFYSEVYHPSLHQTFMTLFPSVPNNYGADVLDFEAMVDTRNKIESEILRRVGHQVTSMHIVGPMQVPTIQQAAWLRNLRRIEIVGTHQLKPNTVTGNGANLDAMLQFLEQHQRLWSTGGGRKRKIQGIQELVIGDVDDMIYPQPRRLVLLIATLGDRLTSLDVSNWPEAVWYMGSIPMKNLRTLLLHQGKEPTPEFSPVQIQGGAMVTPSGDAGSLESITTLAQFLGQGKKLEEVRTFITDGQIFEAWRVDFGEGGSGRKRLHEGELERLRTDMAKMRMHDPLSVLNPFSRMPPPQRLQSLTRIELGGIAEHVIQALNEAANMFHLTLVTIQARSWFSGRLTATPLSWSKAGGESDSGQQTSLGRLNAVNSGNPTPLLLSSSFPFTSPLPSFNLSTNYWMPNLSFLDLEGEVCWTFDLESLLCCPKLSRVRFSYTGFVPSKAQRRQNKVQVLKRLWSLQDVELCGQWITLRNQGWAEVLIDIPNLERVNLVKCEDLLPQQALELLSKAILNRAGPLGKMWEDQEMSLRAYDVQSQSVTSLPPSLSSSTCSDPQPRPPVQKSRAEMLDSFGTRLCWLLVNKRLEDAIAPVWARWRRDHATNPFISAMATKAKFSFVPIQRPSR